MQNGLFLDAEAPVNEDPSTLVTGLKAETRAARDGGFDFISMGQHYLTDYHQLQPLPMLARLAPEAGSMALGTGVLLLPLHHPVHIAESLATLSTLGNRVIAGVGAGYREVEFDSFGVRKAERGSRLEEGGSYMRRLWKEDIVTIEGEFYGVDSVAINPQPSNRPPIWIGASAVPSVERAARIADGWYAIPSFSFDQIREHATRFD